jgi:hypothetical protein
MSDGPTTERDLDREGRRLERLRLVASVQPEPDDEAEEEFDPDPLDAA